MKRLLRLIFLGIIPAFGLVAGGIWYQRTSETSIQYRKNFEVLKTTCEDSAGTAGKKDQKVSAYVDNVCTCFAKAALKHRSIAVASIVTDADIVHSILADCSKRVPSSVPAK